MDEIRAAYEADTALFEEYKARVGLHPAASTSSARSTPGQSASSGA